MIIIINIYQIIFVLKIYHIYKMLFLLILKLILFLIFMIIKFNFKMLYVIQEILIKDKEQEDVIISECNFDKGIISCNLKIIKKIKYYACYDNREIK